MPPTLRPNEPDASKRRMRCYLYQSDGASPLARGTDLTGALWIAQGTSEFTVAAAGTMTNDSRTLSFTAITFTASSTTDELTATAHGLQNLDLVQVTNSGGALPTGLAASTNYWVIPVDANNVKLATSLANAIAGTAIDLTTNGTGTNQVISVAASVRYLDGSWTYEATQSELNFEGSEFSLLVSKSGTLQEDIFTASMSDRPEAVYVDGPTFIQSETDATKMVVQFPWFDAAGRPGATAPVKTEISIHALGGSWANPTNDAALVSATAGMVELALTTAELGTAGPFWVKASKTGYRDVYVLCHVSSTTVGQDVWSTVLEGSHTAGDLMRGEISLLGGAVGDFTTNTFNFKSLDLSKVRWTGVVDATGRKSITPGDLT